MPSQAQWSKPNQFFAPVGAYDEAMPLAVNALLQMRRLVLFDQGRIYFMDADGKVFDKHLVGVSKRITKFYHGYYSTVDDDRCPATRLAKEAGCSLRSAEVSGYGP